MAPQEVYLNFEDQQQTLNGILLENPKGLIKTESFALTTVNVSLTYTGYFPIIVDMLSDS